MDGQPEAGAEAGDRVPVAERAQWERARKVREAHDAEERDRQAGRQADAAAADAAAVDSASKGLRVIAVVVALLFVGVVALMLVVIRQRSNEQPAWVAQLGLEKGVSSGEAAPSRLSSVTTDGSTASTSAPASTVSTGGSAAVPPAIVTTGEDFDQVWRQIEVLEGWLLTHPDSNRVTDIYVSGTKPYDDLTSLLHQLRSDHQTLEVEGYRILGVTVDGRPSADRVELRYADTYTDRVTVDATTGAVVSREPYDGRARLWTLSLQRGADGRWRLLDTAFVSFGDVVPPA
jgi:hypothetical protein